VRQFGAPLGPQAPQALAASPPHLAGGH
jgi:hypothetical protein